MRRLALDTSSRACTVAVRVDGRLVERHEELEREHTRLLMPMIRDALHDAGVRLAELDAIVLGNGPGSFIGMRIAASVAQGLAHGAGLPLVPVSSLAAVAAEVFAGTAATKVAVAQDAHMHEVYLGLYARGDDDLPVAVTEERLQGQSVIPELAMAAPEYVAAGQGWQRYPDLHALHAALLALQSKVLYPRARFLLDLSELAEPISPVDIQPAYLRQKVAAKPRTAAS